MTDVMKKLRVKEVVLNCGAKEEKLVRAVKLLKLISGQEPKIISSRKRIPSFSVRPGLEVGCKVTLRGKKAEEILKRLLETIGNQLAKKQIGWGHINFGIEEYISVPGLQFQRDIGMLGFDVAVNLARAGLCVEKKKIKGGKIPLRHKISKEETAKFFQENYHIKITERKVERR